MPIKPLNHLHWLYIIPFLLLVTLCGCGSDNTVEETVPKGNLSGVISVNSELGIPLGTLENITVQVTQVHSGEVTLTSTDSQGKFDIQQLPVGRYNITYSREDLTDYRFFNMLILAGHTTNLREVDMVQPASIQHTDIDILVDEVAQLVQITGKIDPPPDLFNQSRIRIFFSTAANPSPYRYNDNVSVIPIAPDTFITQIQLAEFEFRGYVPGQLVHLVAYGSTDYVGDTYVDASTDLTIFTGLNPKPSVRASVRMPVITE